MYYVYCLQSLKNKNWLYVGFSDDLRKRLLEHKRGQTHSTARYLPVKLVYYESFLDKHDATQREYELKHSSQQKEFLKKRIKGSLR